jgi:RimJ/RimL family protein N-acetyltransferase
MVFNTKVTDKTGKEIELRNAELKDAEALLNYLKVTNTESKYIICEPDEITMSLDDEKAFITRKTESENELLLLAFEDGKHIGNCSLMSVGTSTRYKHRCTIAIALYKAYCGRGIGRLMLETVLSEAKKLGYGQAELEVVTENLGAIALYEAVGFVKYGVLPNSMKYRDGTTVDSYWMVKIL